MLLQGRKLIIPPALQFVADRLLQTPMAELVLLTMTLNAIKNMGMVPEGYVVNNYLTDTDALVLKTDCPDGFPNILKEPNAQLH